MAGFLVPFATGALIERQRIADAYDEKSGEVIDTVSKKLTLQFDENQKSLANESANYDAVSTTLGMPIAEIAQRGGMLVDVNTAQVVDHVRNTLEKAHPGFIKWIKDQDITTLQDTHPEFFESAFSTDLTAAKAKLKDNRKLTAQSMNKGAISSLSKLFLGEEDKEPTKVEKVQKFLFGEPVTAQTGVAFESALTEAVGEPVRIKSDAATVSLMKEFYTEQGETFDNINDQAFYAWNKIMKWNARTGESFFALSDDRKNDVGRDILPRIGNTTLYNYVENEYLANPTMQKLTADLYTNNPTWMAVQNAIVIASQLGYDTGEKRKEPLPSDITKPLENTTVGDMISDYESLMKINTAFDNQFKLVIDQAKNLSKDIAGGDPVKVAERIGQFYTTIGFSDELKVGDINPENSSGIIGTFITPSSAKNKQGVKMYIYRGSNGKYWAIPLDAGLRLSSNPLPLLEEQVNKILNK